MNTMICRICGQKAFVYCVKGQATYFRCRFCETIFQHPVPTLQEMTDYANTEYSDGLYKEYLDANDLKYPTFEYRLSKVLEVFQHQILLGKPPRMLDVGCSNGRFIEVAIRNGIDAWGLELSERAISAAASETRARIYHGDANEVESLGIGKFNIITAFDLIEHLFDPVGFLNNLSKIIIKGGLIVITTPDASSLLRVIMGKNWSMLQPFQHTLLLSRKASKILLQRAKYKQISITGTKKILTPDYLFRQLKGPNPSLYSAYTLVKRILPRFVRENRFQVNIGEMMIAASPVD